MKYDQSQFIWDVINEAIALRKHATQEERGKLDFNRLSVMSEWGCIYGQTTGSCFSRRAAELIQLCCQRYFRPEAIKLMSTIERVIENANGTVVPDFINIRTSNSSIRHFSAIEAYITLPDAKNENLIAYLRGDSNDLDIYL